MKDCSGPQCRACDQIRLPQAGQPEDCLSCDQRMREWCPKIGRQTEKSQHIDAGPARREGRRPGTAPHTPRRLQSGWPAGSPSHIGAERLGDDLHLGALQEGQVVDDVVRRELGHSTFTEAVSGPLISIETMQSRLGRSLALPERPLWTISNHGTRGTSHTLSHITE